MQGGRARAHPSSLPSGVLPVQRARTAAETPLLRHQRGRASPTAAAWLLSPPLWALPAARQGLLRLGRVQPQHLCALRECHTEAGPGPGRLPLLPQQVQVLFWVPDVFNGSVLAASWTQRPEGHLGRSPAFQPRSWGHWQCQQRQQECAWWGAQAAPQSAPPSGRLWESTSQRRLRPGECSSPTHLRLQLRMVWRLLGQQLGGRPDPWRRGDNHRAEQRCAVSASVTPAIKDVTIRTHWVKTAVDNRLA